MSDVVDKKTNYMPGLDGLRALAVLAVIAFHLNLPFATGGFIGVTVFFVLSGYLITDLLLFEWKNTKKINLKNFWIKRAKRLFPAILLLIISLFIFVSIFRPDLLTKLRQDSIPGLFYYSNWYSIFKNTSYFDTFDVSLLNHFWSLSVEEQFYIVWPLIIFFALNLFKNKKLIFRLVLVLAGLSAILMVFMFTPGQDPSRVYYGTDTRAFSLLIGAALAFVWPSNNLKNNIKKQDKLFSKFLA